MIPLLNYCVVLAGSTLKAMKCKEKQVIACGLEFQNVGVVVRDEARLARKRLLRRNLESGSPVFQEGQCLRRRDESSTHRGAASCFESNAICQGSNTPCSTQWLDGQFVRPLARPVLSHDNSRLLLRQLRSSPGKLR